MKVPAVSVDPASWNTVVIAGIRYAGNARVMGEKPHRCDRKRAPGEDNAQLTSLGFGDAPIVISLTICDEPGSTKQWDSFQSLIPLLEPAKGKAVQALDVYHPALAVYGIKKLYLTSLGVPQLRGQEPDVLEVRIRFSQFSPQQPRKVATAKASVPSRSSFTTSSPAGAVPPADEVPVGGFTPGVGQGAVAFGAGQNFSPSPQQLDPPSFSQGGP